MESKIMEGGPPSIIFDGMLFQYILSVAVPEFNKKFQDHSFW